MEMNEKAFTNKKDITIYHNGNIVPLVYDFSISLSSENKGLYEILSTTPWQITGEKTQYEIIIKRYSDSLSPFQEQDFSLCFAGRNNTVNFSECNIKESRIFSDDKGNILESYIIHGVKEC